MIKTALLSLIYSQFSLRYCGNLRIFSKMPRLRQLIRHVKIIFYSLTDNSNEKENTNYLAFGDALNSTWK